MAFLEKEQNGSTLAKTSHWDSAEPQMVSKLHKALINPTESQTYMIATVPIFPHSELCKLFLQQKITVSHTLQKYIEQSDVAWYFPNNSH